MPDPVPYNEAEVLANIALGDEQAFTLVFDANWANVYGHVLAYVKSAERAEELTQDIFLKLWQQRARLTEVQNFKSYLFILGRNYVISAMRNKLHSAATVASGILEEDMLIPDRQLHYKETYERILKAIETLPPVRRKVFEMSRFNNLSHEAIAADLGIARNTVKQHIVLALNSLRNYFRDNPEALIVILVLFSKR